MERKLSARDARALQRRRTKANKKTTETRFTKEDLCTATLNDTVPMIIDNSGSSSTCVQKGEQIQVSKCGNLKWSGPPFDTTGEESDKVFLVALGHMAQGGEIVDLHLPLQQKAKQ